MDTPFTPSLFFRPTFDNLIVYRLDFKCGENKRRRETFNKL